jgi:hypothetical protein
MKVSLTFTVLRLRNAETFTAIPPYVFFVVTLQAQRKRDLLPVVENHVNPGNWVKLETYMTVRVMLSDEPAFCAGRQTDEM